MRFSRSYLLLFLPSAFSIVIPSFSDNETLDDHSFSEDGHSISASIASRLFSRGLGINCRGDYACSSNTRYNDLAASLTHLLQKIPDDRVYKDQEKIACVKGVGNPYPGKKKLGAGDDSEYEPAKKSGFLCAYLKFHDRSYENQPELVSGAVVKRLARAIVNHGCQRCGSVPLNWPKGNDGSIGELTFNAKTMPCPNENFGLDSICPESKTGDELAHGVTTGSTAIDDMRESQAQAAKDGKKPVHDEDDKVKDKLESHDK